MAFDYKVPSVVRDDYLGILKATKPDVNIDQEDSDWWIKASVIGGVVSGIYADQQKIDSDIFPQSARSEAIDKHLETWGIGPRKEASQAEGFVAVTGDIGTSYLTGVIFKHDPTGNTYSITDDVTLTAVTGEVPAQSIDVGQDQNLLPNTTLSMPSPPVGHSAAQVIIMGDGRDIETDAEASARILARIQSPISGGTESDYRQWALEADASVTSASVVRFPRGPGSVSVYITSGTTDIDAAINEGQDIVRVPSPQLLETVQTYVDGKNPLTDCADVLSVNEVEQDVDIRVKYRDGITGTTILSGQTLTCEELVVREVSRALYKVPAGGRKIAGIGYVLASEIEEVVDIGLSAQPYAEGIYAQILADRQVMDLAASGPNREVAKNEIIIPGNIVVIDA